MHTITIRIAGAVNTYNVPDDVAARIQRREAALRDRGIDVVSAVPAGNDDFLDILDLYALRDALASAPARRASRASAAR